MRISRILHRLILVVALSAVTGLPLAGQDASQARLTFTKTFKGSHPEYIKITVDESGQTSYQGGSLQELEAPESFRTSPELTRQLFSLAAELNYFQGISLDEGKRVAYMGEKTFAYQKGDQRAEASYNYTTNDAAEKLRQLFESIARTRFLIAELEHHLVFDRLGLMETLSQVERDLNAGRLAALEQFAPVLDKIAGDTRLMRLAQTHARQLLRRMGGAPATLNLEYGDQQTGWYYKLVLVEGGAATYEVRRFGDSPQPRILQLPEPAVKRVWELVRLANYFRDLASYQEPLGRLSGYRFIYESGAEHAQVAFSSPPSAAVGEIVHIFQQAVQQENYRTRLNKALAERSLMLQVVLQELEKAVSADELIDPEEFRPLLEGIANGNDQHELVREQAQRLLARIDARNP